MTNKRNSLWRLAKSMLCHSHGKPVSMANGVWLSHSQRKATAPVTKNYTMCCLIMYVPTVVMQAPQQFAAQHEHHCLLATYSSPVAQAEALVTPQDPKIWHGIRQVVMMPWISGRKMKSAKVNTAKGTCRRNMCGLNMCTIKRVS